MTNITKKSVLVIGAGSVGAIAALNLEAGGLASVTVVLRSNYSAVKEHGYTIESCDHGSLKGFRPSVGMLSLVIAGERRFEYLTNQRSSQHDPRHRYGKPSTVRLHRPVH